MSVRVKARLAQLAILENTDHELRVELDQEIERMTGKYCDEGVADLSDAQIRALVAMLQERRRRKARNQAMTEQEEKEYVSQQVSAYA
jgi:hypothetical protein